MIPGDIGAELARAIDAAIAHAELPPGAQARSSAAGTWRPAPAEAGGSPRTYATSLPFGLAEATGLDAAAVAELLAAKLRCVTWIAAASVTGSGYLTVAVTADTLAGLAVRVTEAGDRYAGSDALAGTERSARLPGAPCWATWLCLGASLAPGGRRRHRPARGGGGRPGQLQDRSGTARRRRSRWAGWSGGGRAGGLRCRAWSRCAGWSGQESAGGP